jgi:hypothetical protein
MTTTTATTSEEADLQAAEADLAKRRRALDDSRFQRLQRLQLTLAAARNNLDSLQDPGKTEPVTSASFDKEADRLCAVFNQAIEDCDATILRYKQTGMAARAHPGFTQKRDEEVARHRAAVRAAEIAYAQRVKEVIAKHAEDRKAAIASYELDLATLTQAVKSIESEIQAITARRTP